MAVLAVEAYAGGELIGQGGQAGGLGAIAGSELDLQHESPHRRIVEEAFSGFKRESGDSPGA
jgi:hypothetical protein